MPLIGTAGHVDHGKSTLIHRITGRDPDRWDEEKRRGLTIDLGFAWATLPNGMEVSFVDVPGHERFVKNMLAGVEAIDVALFVVAADEGWMPQSEEHLAVLDLLDVSRGVVALTKVDVVDRDLVDLAREEVADHLAGTSLAGSAIHAVSSVTGEGIDSLLAALASLLPDADVDRGRPRLWIDRSFTISGAGSVVTGSLLDGWLAVDDTVEIYPARLEARIRGIQSHERSHVEVAPGRRVAVNLAGVDRADIARGDMLGGPGDWELSDRFSATIRPARFVSSLDQRGAYQIHLGSSAEQVEIVGLEDGVAVLQIDRPLPVAVGDRFVLRDTGRHLVVGGGRVLDPGPGRTGRALAAAASIELDDPDAAAAALLSIRRFESVTSLRAQSGGGFPGGAIVVGDRAIDPTFLDQLAERAVTLVAGEHQAHPLRSGMPLATLAERLRVDIEVAEAVVTRSERLGRIGPDVAVVGHRPVLSADLEDAWEKAREVLAESLAVPEDGALGLDPELLHLKVRNGELVRVSPSLVYLPSQIDELLAHMRSLGDGFTVSEFRDAARLSRKYAVPILEWSDREGLTVRSGDLRRLR